MDTVRWAYRIITIRSEDYRIDPAKESELNALGDDGWELVAITAINYKSAATDHVGMVFKQPKASPANLASAVLWVGMHLPPNETW